MNRNKKIRIWKLFESVLLILFLLMFVIAAPLQLTARDTYSSSDLPTMDVWLDFGDNTYINFFGAAVGDHYEVSLFASNGTTQLAGPCPWGLTAENEWTSFDDFGVVIQAGNIISLVYAPDGVPTTFEKRYQVADFGVTEANVNTEIITGYTNGTESVETIIFYGDIENDPDQNMRHASVVNGIWTADFSAPGDGYGTYNIDTQTRGIIGQPDGLGNATYHSWMAPNPEFAADPIANTVSGAGWPGDVTVDLTPNDPTTGIHTIPIDGNGNFQQVSLDGADIYAGQEIRIWDYMITKDFTVSSLKIKYIDTVNDKIYLTSGPDAYVQAFVQTTTMPPDGFPYVYLEGKTDANGLFIADFAVGDPTIPTIPYDLTSTSSGFTREYHSTGDATMFGWSAADYYIGISGDIDGSGVIDKIDVKMLTQYIAEKITLTINQKAVADYNNDGVVNTLDLKAMQKVIHTKVK